MDTRIAELSDLRLVGHAARVPLIHNGVNPHIQAHIASLPADEHLRLKALSSAEPAGLLQVSADVDPDYTEGSELTYLHGVAVLKSSARSRMATIEGPGRSRHGLDGNQSAAVAAHVDCRAAGYGPEVRNTAQLPAGTSITSRPSGTVVASPTATPCR